MKKLTMKKWLIKYGMMKMNFKLKYFVTGLIVMGFFTYGVFAVESNIIQNYQERLDNLPNINCTQELYKQSLEFGNYTIEKGDLMTIEDLSAMLGENLTYNIVYADSYYYLVKNANDVRQFLYYDNTKSLSYQPTTRDCDDIALILLGHLHWHNGGMAIGMLYISNSHAGHAVDFFVDNNHTIWIIEAQTGSIYHWDDIKDDWNVEFGLV